MAVVQRSQIAPLRDKYLILLYDWHQSLPAFKRYGVALWAPGRGRLVRQKTARISTGTPHQNSSQGPGPYRLCVVYEPICNCEPICTREFLHHPAATLFLTKETIGPAIREWCSPLGTIGHLSVRDDVAPRQRERPNAAQEKKANTLVKNSYGPMEGGDWPCIRRIKSSYSPGEVIIHMSIRC